MKAKTRKLVLTFMTALLLLGLLGNSTSAFAERNTFSLSPRVIASGGMGAVQGSVILRSSLGQPMVGTAVNSSVAVQSGFWTTSGMALFSVFLPMVVR